MSTKHLASLFTSSHLLNNSCHFLVPAGKTYLLTKNALYTTFVVINSIPVSIPLLLRMFRPVLLTLRFKGIVNVLHILWNSIANIPMILSVRLDPYFLSKFCLDITLPLYKMSLTLRRPLEDQTTWKRLKGLQLIFLLHQNGSLHIVISESVIPSLQY